MATGNFLQWNPGQANQQSDMVFLADNQRLNGATSPSPLPSALGNKLFYQSSTFCSAFAQMMVAKGYNMLDTDKNALAGVMANVYTVADNLQPALGFTPVQQGTGVGQLTNVVKIGWSSASRTKITIDTTDQGNIVMDSDLAVETARAVAAEAALQSAINLINTPTTVTNQTGARAFATTYQNTSGFRMVVQVTCELTGGVGQSANLFGQVGSTSFGLSDTSSNSITNDAGTASVTIIVPNGWYYAARYARVPPNLLLWYETIN